MLLSAAQVLVQDMHLHDYDPNAEQHTRQLLASWAYAYSSQVSLDFPHALVLEIGASRALFGDWLTIQQRLRNELHELGFRHRLVAAPTPHAARVLANVHDGLGIDAQQLPAALAQLPLPRCGLPNEAVTVLGRSGLRTLGAVLELPRDSLARRFAPRSCSSWMHCVGYPPRHCATTSHRTVSMHASNSSTRSNPARPCCFRCVACCWTWPRSCVRAMAACSASTCISSTTCCRPAC